MLTVAIVGPDGAGKTTVARRVASLLPVPTTYMYMGDNPAALSHSLPTTRLRHRLRRHLSGAHSAGPADPDRMRTTPRGWRRAYVELRALLRLANQAPEEWYRQALAQRELRRGRVVLFDRHFFSDYHAYDIVGTNMFRPFARRLHGWMLLHLYPKPDVVIVLDAAPELLLARKHEGTIKLLGKRRQDYRELAGTVAKSAIVDASQPIEVVSEEVARIIMQHIHSQRAGIEAE